MSNNLQAALESLLGTTAGVSVYLTEQPEGVAEGVPFRQFFLAMREDEPMLAEFSAHLANKIIGYCLPRKRILKELSRHQSNPLDMTSAISALRREAREAFQQYREKCPARSGEAGEMLAYLFTEHFLRAPMAIAKMHTKTNSDMPVFGADGVHVRYRTDIDSLEVFYLESKVHKTIGSAATDAAKSISDFRQGKQRSLELKLALDFGNFDHLDDSAQEALADFLDPYSGAKTAKRLDRHASMLAYNEPAFSKVKGAGAGEEVRAKFLDRCDARHRTVTGAYAARTLPQENIVTFVFGLPSVSDFRREFERALSNG
ncbi:HamA C-terminal domain-containing protein [Paraburkholderia phytofirmans]|uniref:HamA C-terminal domain-containing protein n=1 Tax=Paraburkholderia phytofirmans TaxID=261302 RepID=UPI0038BB137F